MVAVLGDFCRRCCCCWLLQAGKQLEWLTGGRVKAGMHEVQRGSSSSRSRGKSCAEVWKLHSTTGVQHTSVGGSSSSNGGVLVTCADLDLMTAVAGGGDGGHPGSSGSSSGSRAQLLAGVVHAVLTHCLRRHTAAAGAVQE